MISGEILKIRGSYLHGLHCIICKQNSRVCLEHRELGKIREKRRKFGSDSTCFLHNLGNNENAFFFFQLQSWKTDTL